MKAFNRLKEIIVGLLLLTLWIPVYAKQGLHLPSASKIEHLDLKSDLWIKHGWKYATDDSGQSCKLINPDIEGVELEQLFGVPLSQYKADVSNSYGSDSPLFDSCNYIGGYQSRWFSWGQDQNHYVHWTVTERYLDTEHAIVLLRETDEGRFSAIYIYKEYQTSSNRDVPLTEWIRRVLKVLF